MPGHRLRTPLITFLLFLAAVSSVSAGIFGRGDDRFSLDFDSAFAADLVFARSTQFCLGAELRLDRELSLRLVQTACVAGKEVFAESGLFLVYHPYGTGPFVSLSLLHFGFEVGQKLLSQSLFSLNEVSLGWVWSFDEHLCLRAEAVFRDPSGAFREEYSIIRSGYRDYGTFRVRLALGWILLREEEDEKT